MASATPPPCTALVFEGGVKQELNAVQFGPLGTWDQVSVRQRISQSSNRAVMACSFLGWKWRIFHVVTIILRWRAGPVVDL